MKLPQGPKTHSFIQLAQWVRSPIDYLEKTAAEFGDIFTMRMGLKNFVIVSDPTSLQTLFTHPAITAPGEANELARPLLGNNSLILLSGQQHQQRRKLLMPSFHGERMSSYGELIKDITRKIISQWQPQQSFAVRDTMQEITMGVILQAVFGLHQGERLEQLRSKLSQRLAMTASGIGSILIFLLPLQKDWGPWKKILQQQRECDELIYALIRERRTEFDSNRTDILTLLLSATDENGDGLTDEELRDELMTLLIAGHETTATALTWALYWIHKYPDVFNRLQQELEQVGSNPDPMTIFRLPYLSAVCNETLRIYPVVTGTLSRIVQSPVEMKGQILEPGTELIGSIYLAHHREEVYPNSKQFKPERFLERQFSPYEFLPFGGGTRRCIGLALAQFEMKLVLATMIQEAVFGLTSDQPLSPTRRGALLAPDPSFKMTLVSRQSRRVVLV